jgi:enoyl-CoA hydratase/carnithine racemase
MSPQTEVLKTTLRDGIAEILLSRPHGNAINQELVEALPGAFSRAEEDPAVRGILLGAEGRLFCPGLDLQELVRLDRAGMERFMLAFRRCLLRMYRSPRPVVAALGGHALAGGCVLAMTADWRVLRQDALIGLNEIRVGVPLPFWVAQLLRESVHRPRVGEIALLGRNYSNAEAVEAGLVHEVAAADRVREQATVRLNDFAERDPEAFAATKGYLRHAAVESIRSLDDAFAEEFLDGWFSPETRRRIDGIVESLQQRER